MKLFRCSICGENFPGILTGETDPIGFYTTRFVRADTPEEAEILALTLLRDDPRLQVDPTHRTSDTKVYFEAIDELDEMPNGLKEPGGGYTFFPMES